MANYVCYVCSYTSLFASVFLLLLFRCHFLNFFFFLCDFYRTNTMCFMTSDRFYLSTKTLHLQRCLGSITIHPIYGTYIQERIYSVVKWEKVVNTCNDTLQHLKSSTKMMEKWKTKVIVCLLYCTSERSSNIRKQLFSFCVKCCCKTVFTRMSHWSV